MKRATPESVQKALPEAVRPWVTALCEAGDEVGTGIHLIGGPVRDFLLGRLMRDADLLAEPRVGEADAAAVAARLALPSVRVVVHKRFGTVRLEGEGQSLDLATVRRETYASPGALPKVAAGDLDDDLRRRDFSVNALAVPLNATAREGRPALIDPGQGVDDLRAGVLRTFHVRSFHDDPTRALRAARLAPRLGFRLARSARSSLRAAVRDGAFGAVKGERYRAEFEKLFADPVLGLDPSRAAVLLHEWHVLAALEPGFAFPKEARMPLRRFGRDVVALPPEDEEALWVAGLRLWLASLDAPLRRRVLRRLAVRGEAARAIVGHPTERARLLRELDRARGRGALDAVVRGLPSATVRALLAEAQAPLRRRLLRWRREDRSVALPVSGTDLVEIGLAGPAVGRALERIRLGVLDGVVRGPEDALALAREVGSSSRARPRRPVRRERPEG